MVYIDSNIFIIESENSALIGDFIDCNIRLIDEL